MSSDVLPVEDVSGCSDALPLRPFLDASGRSILTKEELMSMDVEAPLFHSSEDEPVATGLPVAAGGKAILQPHEWYGDCQPIYRHRGVKQELVYRINHKSDRSNFVPMVGEAAWTIVNAFDIPTAQLHLLFAAYATYTDRPWTDEFHLRGSDLIKLLGLDRRTNLSKAEKLRRIIDIAQNLGYLGVEIRKLFDGNRVFAVKGHSVWEVGISMVGQETLLTAGDRDAIYRDIIPEEIVFTVRPGIWSKAFLNMEGLKDESTLNHFGYLAELTTGIDHYHEPLTAKLAIFLTLTPQRDTFKVSTLLEQTCGSKELQKAKQDRRFKNTTKEQWNDALLSLKKRGWKIVFNPNKYSKDLWPAWALEEGDQPRRLTKGYFDRLLNSVITIEPPGKIPDKLRSNRKKQAILPKPKPCHYTGGQLRQARNNKALTMRGLAEIVGKSPAWINKIEKGKQRPKMEDLKALISALGLEESSK